MTEQQKTTLEGTHILIDSDLYTNVTNAISRQTKDLYICVDDKIIPIQAEQVREFAAELLAVWEHITR